MPRRSPSAIIRELRFQEFAQVREVLAREQIALAETLAGRLPISYQEAEERVLEACEELAGFRGMEKVWHFRQEIKPKLLENTDVI